MPYKDLAVRKAYMAKYTRAHRVEYREKWRAQHPDATRRMYDTLEQATEARREQARDRYAADIEKSRAYVRAANKKRYETKPDEVKAAVKKWATANPEYVYAAKAEYRARKRNAAGDGVSASQWAELKEYYGNRCAYCLRGGVKLTQDHIIPLTSGGKHEVENIAPACLSCNTSKGAKSIFTMVNRSLMMNPALAMQG